MKKITAILLTLALILGCAVCLASCGAKTEPEATTVEDTTAEETTAAEVEETEAETVLEETEAETVEETEAAGIAKPETTEDIISVYNNAINAAYDAKVGFAKERYTDNEKMDAGVALKAFKSLVYKFIGIGADNKYTENVSKGNWDGEARKHFLRQSSLTASDVTAATCTENDGKYTIVLNVKGGSSTGSESAKNTNAPIDKCGICVGNEDKGYYDHKTAEVIYDAIDDTYSSAKIGEQYSNAKVTAVIDSATGNVESLKVDFDISVNIDLGIGKGTASGTTHIVYKDFKY